eukprot:4178622-Prymnesium_polylepis.1
MIFVARSDRWLRRQLLAQGLALLSPKQRLHHGVPLSHLLVLRHAQAKPCRPLPQAVLHDRTRRRRLWCLAVEGAAHALDVRNVLRRRQHCHHARQHLRRKLIQPQLFGGAAYAARSLAISSHRARPAVTSSSASAVAARSVSAAARRAVSSEGMGLARLGSGPGAGRVRPNTSPTRPEECFKEKGQVCHQSGNSLAILRG